MRTRQSPLQHGVSPRQQVLGPPSLHAADILPASSWPVKKKRTKLSALTAVAGLDLPKCSNGLPASGTSTGSSHDEESGRRSSDAGPRPGPVLCYTRRKIYKRRKILSPCVRAAAAASASASATTSTQLADECDDAGDAQDECEDAADAHDECEVAQGDCEDAQGDCELAQEAEDNLEVAPDAEDSLAIARDAEDDLEVNGDTSSNGDLRSGLHVYPVASSEYSPGDVPFIEISTDDEHRTTSTPSDVEMSEESGPSSWLPTTGELSPSIRKRRDVAPPVSAEVAGTTRAEIGTNCKKPEAAAAGAVVRRRPQRQKKPTSRVEFLDTSTPLFEWLTFYPNVPFPEGDEDELGAVEPISNGSEGDPSDISDSAHKPYSLKLQTDIQKTSKARRIFPSTASPDDFAPPPPPLPAAGAPRPLPQETSLFLDPQTPDKLQESNGECEMGIRTSATLSETTAIGDDKDSSWTPSDDDSARNGGRRSHSPVTVSVKISGRTPAGSRLLQNIYPESATFKAKDLKLKVKKKRPRPKVWRPEKVKVAKRAKTTKSTSNGKRHLPARGASEQKNVEGGGAAAAAVCDHSRGATPMGQNVQFNIRQQHNEHSIEAAGLASVPPAAVMPDTFIASEAIDNVMALVSDRGTITVDLTSPKVPSLNSGPTCEVGAECSFPFEQVVDLGASELTTEKTTSEMDLRHRLDMNEDRSIPNLRGFPVADGSNSMDDPPCTPRGNMLAVLPASEPFLNSESFAPEENAFGGGDSSDSDGDQRSHAPTRRKRSNLSQRTRRSLLPAVESAAAAAAAAAGPAAGTPVAASVRVNQKFKQLVCLDPSPASPSPLPLQSRDSDAQEPLPLVVYGQRSTDMVVYQDMIPRFKYKPKVDLDSLTCDTFQRLMLQGGMANDADHADEDWFAARKLWSDRAREFNGIMRRVQGDRAFSKWKGSVLDSIIGAFLTQNVSDFLSSNAFMSLRARFPVREDTQGETDAPTQERSSLAEAMTPNQFPVGTSVDIVFRAPQRAGEHVPMAGSDELVNAVSIDNQQESASLMPGAETQNGSGVADVCVMDSRDATFLVEPQATTVAFLNSTSGAGRDADQSDPCSFSGDDRNAETRESGFGFSDIVERVEQVQLGFVSVALGSCPSIGMASPSAIRDEPLAADVADATPPFPATIVEVPTPVDTEPGSHGMNPEAVATMDVKEQVDHNGRAAQHSKAISSSSSKDPSMLQDKFGLSWDDKSATPDGTERALAAALRAILGKQITGREQAAETGNRVPLKPVKSRQPRNRQRFLDMTKFKPNVRLLTGRERANYEFSVNYKLDSEQKGTWEACRAELLLNKEFERDPFTAHSVDWEEVRRAPVAAIANVIKERGMNNILGGRIKSLLDRIHRDQDGSLDLEWVRKLSPIDAQNFLTSIRGLGIKSVECIRLLTLHHPSFPVDTNVGRIVVRLGWVPLEPLPEETQLHLLEMYPVQEHIQKYIWPRLCTLDQETLYEFHYQLITFGKVFCTKSKPNCNACPLRSQCKHYESAYCSARPLLMGPEEASEHQIVPLPSRSRMQTSLEERQRLFMLEGNARESGKACVPIIEEPNSPEYIQDIEDIPFTEGTGSVELLEENVDLEPSTRGGGSLLYVELNQTSAQHVSQESCMGSPSKGAQQEPEGCIEGVVEELMPQVPSEEVAFPYSQELVLLPPEAASFPAPQLKNVQRLRTIHYVYELPDHHPLLAKMDKRDPEDPCFYLLAIWNSDEVPDVMPKISDDDASNPFACCQSGEESVRGTLLVPCRTAMKGSFPLNGTYFQVNEVFADHGSSIKPIDVPRTFLWNLKRRFVYFGTSVTSIFKDMSQEEIQCCFKKGYICVRAFDQITRYPKLLAARLHQSGAKIVAARAVGLKGRRASQSKVAS